jgi:hypothetical protein
VALVVLRAPMVETAQVPLLPTLDRIPQLELATVVKVRTQHLIRRISLVMVAQTICIAEVPVMGMVEAEVPVLVVLDQTVSTLAVKAVPVVLVVSEFQVRS